MTHFSELSVDKLLAGELTGAAAAALRAHAADCARCSETLGDAVTTREQFAQLPAWTGITPITRVKRWQIAAPLAALAAALALVLAWPRAQPDHIRTKGTAIVGFFVAHGDAVRRGTLRETVTPGDRLELVTSTTESGWFAAISDDQLGVRSIYVPLVKIEPGRERALNGAIELDAALGHETVTGIFCDHAFEPAVLDLVALPSGCTADRFTLDKVAR
jgi:Putative zinc-finger